MTNFFIYLRLNIIIIIIIIKYHYYFIFLFFPVVFLVTTESEKAILSIA